MNPEVKAIWIAALRSGQYKQGRHRLCTVVPESPEIPPAYCCLAVLCDLHARATGETWLEREPHSREYLGAHEFLPGTVMLWAGLDDRDPKVLPTGSTEASRLHSLSTCNDGMCSKEYTFPEIADLIEAQL